MTSSKPYQAVQFYKDAESLVCTAATFLAEGLKAGQPAILIATPGHTAAIKSHLKSMVDMDALEHTGELRCFDAGKILASFMVGGMPDPGLFKRQIGDIIEALWEGREPGPVRLYGEIVDVLWREGNSIGAVKLEMMCNQLATSCNCGLQCGYAIGHFYKETDHSRRQDVSDQHSRPRPEQSAGS